MAQFNKISGRLDEEHILKIRDSLSSVEETMSKVLRNNLQAKDRMKLPKMGDKTLAFVSKSLEYAAQNKDLCPQYFNLAEAENDYLLSQELYKIFQQVDKLHRAIEDAFIIAGADAYEASLQFYHSVKGAKRSNIPGAEAIFIELSERFVRRRKVKE